MKCTKKTVRHYWKVSYESWTQPVLTSNGVIGADDFAVTSTVGTNWEGSTKVSDAYKVFDGDLTSRFGMHYNSANDLTQALIFYSKNPIKFDSLTIKFYVNDYATWCWRNGTLKGSNDGTTWDDITTFTNTNRELTLQGSNNYYKFYAIYGKSTTVNDSPNVNIYDIAINNGVAKITQPATEDDYDYYTDNEIALLTKENVRRYWKYVDIPFTQPVLTKDTTPGYDDFAPINSTMRYTNQNYPYMAYDGDDTTYAFVYYGTDIYFGFYNPKKLLVTKLEISTSGSVLAYPIVQASNDGNVWVDIQSDIANLPVAVTTINLTNSSKYKYYRIIGKTPGTTSWGIYYLKITATEENIFESTPDDYDFYTDGIEYYGINQ